MFLSGLADLFHTLENVRSVVALPERQQRLGGPFRRVLRTDMMCQYKGVHRARCSRTHLVHTVSNVRIHLELISTCVQDSVHFTCDDSKVYCENRTLHLTDKEVLVESVGPGEEQQFGRAACEEFLAQPREPACTTNTQVRYQCEVRHCGVLR